jgi:hypothetical protein
MDSSEIEKRRQAYEREDRVYDLQPSEAEKRELLHELQDGVWKFVKERAWWTAVIFGVFGVFGVPLLIYTLVERTVDRVAVVPLKAVEKNLTQAELLAERAKKAASDAAAAAAEVNAQVEDLKGKATGVEKRFGLVTEQINAEAKNAALRSTQDFKASQERISRLEALVKKIGDENEATRKATADYAKQVTVLEAQIEKNRNASLLILNTRSSSVFTLSKNPSQRKCRMY